MYLLESQLWKEYLVNIMQNTIYECFLHSRFHALCFQGIIVYFSLHTNHLNVSFFFGKLVVSSTLFSIVCWLRRCKQLVIFATLKTKWRVKKQKAGK